MKKNLYFLITLLAVSFAANAQNKNMEMKKKFNFMLRYHHLQNSGNQNEDLKLKVNPYWQSIDAPHTYNSFMPQVEVPCFNTMWAKVAYDSAGDTKRFLRTADDGKTWRYDTILAPANFAIGNISPVDANTCYAAMYNDATGIGGGVFKTTDGGATWRQIGVHQLYSDSTFIDFVHFFDAQHGVTVGDGTNNDSLHLEIYTTSDAGKTWQQVPKTNIPPTIAGAHSFSQTSLAVYKNRFWFRGYDNLGNNYVYRSDDFGKHWQLFQYNLTTPIYDFAFADKLNGLGVSFDFSDNPQPHLVETHDGGETWADKSFTGYPMGGFIKVIPYTHTYVSTLPGFTIPYGSSYSRDGGKSWILIDSGGIQGEHSDISFLNPFYGWSGRAETYNNDESGGAFKWKLHFSLDDKAIAANDDNNSSATKNDLNNTINARLFPNPAKDVITVNGLNASAKTTLSLFNNSGRLLQQSTATQENHTFNLHNLPAGSYYIKIESGEKNTTLKFVKQ